VKIHVRIEEADNLHLTVPMARALEGCFRAVAARLAAYPNERPRSRTTSGVVVAHGDHLIFVDILSPHVKIVTPQKPTGGK
jgi:hypothetical protein